MHRVQAQKTRLAFGLRLAPLADRTGRGPRPGVVEKPLAVALALAQVIQMRDRNGSQTCVLLLAVKRAISRVTCARLSPVIFSM